MVLDVPREVEIKLALPDEAAYERLRGCLGRPLRAVLQENRFYDGADGELSSHKAVLRLRREQEVPIADGSLGGPGVRIGVGSATDQREARYFLTLKTGGTIIGSVHTRGELEVELPAELLIPGPDPSAILALDLEPIRALREIVPAIDRIVDQGCFGNLRELFHPPAGITLLRNSLWELDRTEFPGGIIDHELEVEMPSAGGSKAGEGGCEEELLALLRCWGVPTSPQRMSKYERFLRYQSGSRDAHGPFHR